MKKYLSKLYNNTYLFCISLALFINIFIETFSRKSLSATISYIINSPFVFIYNTCIILLTLSVVTLLKRRIFGFATISALWLGFGITNGIILSFRATPFTAIDLTLIKSGLSLIKTYMNNFQIFLVIASILAAIIGIIYLWFKAPKSKANINYKFNFLKVLILGFIVGIMNQVGLNFNLISSHFGNLAFAYEDYGFPYCFSSTLLNTGIDKPNDYSKETIENIEKNNISNGTSLLSGINTNDVSKPNIIMLQLESFFDPTHVKGITFSQDPLPNFRSLKENYSSGFLNVASIGAGTANTEFEVITQMNLDFFGPGEYPYKSILKKTTCESTAFNLKELGYSSHAIHNNEGTFYGRNIVFPQIGFDTFTSLEYMPPVETTPQGWAKDYILTDEILKTLKSTTNEDYIYTISVQGHGDYPEEKVLENPTIKISGIEDEKNANAFEYYVNEIHEMDIFIKDLTDALSEFDEDVVLVLYGDHLPSLNLNSEDLDNNNIFQTEYVIWSNFDLPKENKDLETYQLSSTVLNKLNIHTGTLTNFHQQNITKDDYLDNLKLLQYDMLYGNKYIYNSTNPFVATDLKMGINDIVLCDAYNENEDIIIKGENFTEYSYVYINNKKQHTVYIDSNTLKIENKTLEKDDEIKVSQLAKDHVVLSSSNTIIKDE